jgi:hypothetical protein
VGDYRNNGHLNLFVSNFSEEYNVLYSNEGGEYFVDVSFRSGTAASSLPYVGWGTEFFDYDNDGWLDLVVVNGHVYPQLATVNLGASASYRQRRLLYRNRGDGSFEEVGASLGAEFNEPKVSRGLAVGDLDNDGRLDLVINDLDGRAQVLLNETEPAGRWLSVRLIGTPANRSAIGAVIRVNQGETSQMRLVRSGTGYISQSDLRQHFGLGSADKVDVVEVHWPDGSVTRETDVSVDQALVLSHPRASE